MNHPDTGRIEHRFEARIRDIQHAGVQGRRGIEDARRQEARWDRRWFTQPDMIAQAL